MACSKKISHLLLYLSRVETECGVCAILVQAASVIPLSRWLKDTHNTHSPLCTTYIRRSLGGTRSRINYTLPQSHTQCDFIPSTHSHSHTCISSPAHRISPTIVQTDTDTDTHTQHGRALPSSGPPVPWVGLFPWVLHHRRHWSCLTNK